MATSTERNRAMRARRAAAIESGDHPPLLDAEDLLVPKVEASIGAAGLDEQDQAAAALARSYAKAIDVAKDRAWALRWLGPELEKILGDLYLTPAARKAPQKPAAAAPSKLDQLRAARVSGRKPDFL